MIRTQEILLIEEQHSLYLKLLKSCNNKDEIYLDKDIESIIYDFNDSVESYIGYPLYLNDFKDLYEEYKKLQSNKIHIVEIIKKGKKNNEKL